MSAMTITTTTKMVVIRMTIMVTVIKDSHSVLYSMTSTGTESRREKDRFSVVIPS